MQQKRFFCYDGARMIMINDTIRIPDDELHFSHVRASGPGGQHVNKNSTAVQLQFDIKRSPSLNPGVKNRLIKLGGKRVSADGVLTITAQTHRSQTRNREEAVGRLIALVRQAMVRPKKRRKTKPSRAAVERRLQSKRRSSDKKKSREKVRY